MTYQRSTKSTCTDKGIRKSEFVAKTQFISLLFYENLWKQNIMIK